MTCVDAPGAATAISRAQLRFTEAGQTTRYGPRGASVPQRDDRLAGLAEAHVVGEDRAPASEQERDAFDLVREESLRQRGRIPKRAVRIAGREGQELRKGVGLGIQRLVRFHHGAVGWFGPNGRQPRQRRRACSFVRGPSTL